MRHEQQLDAQNSESKQQADAGLIPSISLPKGGGAISGIGEKFGANPVTGTGAMSVSIATSPSRFGPALSLSYDSGAGNGPFGLGWTLSAPAISRKTDKGLPQYRDADESDVLILSAAEDLVPTLMQQNEDWVREILPLASYAGVAYTVQRYRPATSVYSRTAAHGNFPRRPRTSRVGRWHQLTGAGSMPVIAALRPLRHHRPLQTAGSTGQRKTVARFQAVA